MLADSVNTPASSGYFGPDVQMPDTAREELMAFIAQELPRWRDDPERPFSTAETDLTEFLSDHLQSAARHSSAWSRLQFRTEASDAAQKGRKLDIAVKPCGAALVVEGRRHTRFQTLLPIECKRLPIPKGKDRDEREYVISQFSSTGGLQRFKHGHHASDHAFAGMIAYIQDRTPDHWLIQINRWIQECAEILTLDWTTAELLAADAKGPPSGTVGYHSLHTRKPPLSPIRIQHLWIEMGALRGS